jgi:hypothetical protein
MENYEELLDELIKRIDSDRESARTRRSAFIAEGNEEAAGFNHGASNALSTVLFDIKELIREVETNKA